MERIAAPSFANLQSLPITVQGIIGIIVLGIIYTLLAGERPYAGFPVAKLDEKGLAFWLLPHLSWMFKPQAVLTKGKQIANDSGMYQIRSGVGYKIVIPRRFANELRNHKDLTFGEFAGRDFHAQRVCGTFMRNCLAKRS